MKKLERSNAAGVSIEELVRAFLRDNPEIREAMSLIRMSEQEYLQALLAYRVPMPGAPTIASTYCAKQDVNISATTRQPARAS